MTAFVTKIFNTTTDWIALSCDHKVHTLVCFWHDDCVYTGGTKATHYTFATAWLCHIAEFKKEQNKQRFHHQHRHCRATAAWRCVWRCDTGKTSNTQFLLALIAQGGNARSFLRLVPNQETRTKRIHSSVKKVCESHKRWANITGFSAQYQHKCDKIYVDARQRISYS